MASRGSMVSPKGCESEREEVGNVERQGNGIYTVLTPSKKWRSIAKGDCSHGRKKGRAGGGEKKEDGSRNWGQKGFRFIFEKGVCYLREM